MERLEDEPGQASILHQLGELAQAGGHLEDAEHWYVQSLAMEERLGDEHGQASTLHQLGVMAQEQGRLPEAEVWYGRSLALKERLGNEHGQAGTLHNMGKIAEERGNLVEAVRCYERAEALLVRLDDPDSLDIVRASLWRVRGGSHGQDTPQRGWIPLPVVGQRPRSTEDRS
jgi:tetratricopeptide (TPR) repeat protein